LTINIQPSKKSRNDLIRLLLATFTFIGVYIVLILLSLALIALLIVFLLYTIGEKIPFLAVFIVVAIGITIFIVMALFRIPLRLPKGEHTEERIALLHEDAPKLFDAISEIASAMNAPMPNLVYVERSANAGLQVDPPSFKNLFKPSQQLILGFGAITVLSQSELKALIAHELGHAIQKTNSLGYFVFKFNQLMQKVLYDTSYENQILESAGEQDKTTLELIEWFAAHINKWIQKFLRFLFSRITISFYSVSREMEFHADAIAANVVGPNSMATALLQLYFADQTMSELLHFYGNRYELGIQSQNIFEDYRLLLAHLARENDIPLVKERPIFTPQDKGMFISTKLVAVDPWASHPSLKERLERLASCTAPIQNNKKDAAIDLFLTREQLEKMMTAQLFISSDAPQPRNYQTPDAFIKEYIQSSQPYQFPKCFNRYFDYRNPKVLQSNTKIDDIPKDVVFSNLFDTETIVQVKETHALQTDINTIGQLIQQKGDLSFEYEGKKYTHKFAASQLVTELEKDLKSKEETLAAHDQKIFQFFMGLSKLNETENQFQMNYENCIAFEQKMQELYQFQEQVSSYLAFISEVTPIYMIKDNLKEFKPLEQKLREEIDLLANDKACADVLPQEEKEKIQEFIGEPLHYFGVSIYKDKNLEKLYTALNYLPILANQKYFVLKKDLLEQMAMLLTVNPTQNIS